LPLPPTGRVRPAPWAALWGTGDRCRACLRSARGAARRGRTDRDRV